MCGILIQVGAIIAAGLVSLVVGLYIAKLYFRKNNKMFFYFKIIEILRSTMSLHNQHEERLLVLVNMHLIRTYNKTLKIDIENQVTSILKEATKSSGYDFVVISTTIKEILDIMNKYNF